MMTKTQLRAAIDRFLGDPNRIISVKNLCELAGISHDTFRDVFQIGRTPITVQTQLRLEKALKAIQNGEVKVMRNPDKTVTVGYRKKADPQFARGYGLTVKGGKIAVRTGLVNVNDYSRPTFKEELDRT